MKLADSLPGTLSLYAAELSTVGSFDAAVQGATYVFHVASPVNVETDNRTRDVVEATVIGTKHLFEAVAKSKNTVKKVVITSSIWCVLDLGRVTQDTPLHTEAQSNDEIKLDNGPIYMYAASKILQEKEEEKLASKIGVPLAFINPSCILGPILSPKASGFSIEIMKGFTEGNVIMPTFLTWLKVDVRDVALAHIRAAESSTAQGRFILSQECSVSNQAVLDILQQTFPQLHFGTDTDQSAPHKIFNTDKARKELGVYVRPIEETVVDWALTSFQLGLASPQDEMTAGQLFNS